MADDGKLSFKQSDEFFNVLYLTQKALQHVVDVELEYLYETEKLIVLSHNIIGTMEDLKELCKTLNIPLLQEDVDSLSQDTLLLSIKSAFAGKIDEAVDSPELIKSFRAFIKKYNKLDVLTVFPEASVLISKAKVSDSDSRSGDMLQRLQPVYFKAKNGFLFSCVKELFFTGEEIIVSFEMVKGMMNMFVSPANVPEMFLKIHNTFERELITNSLNFVKNYFLIKNCEKSPIFIQTPKEKKSHSGLRQTGGLFPKTVYLSKEYRYRKIEKTKGLPLDKDGKVLTVVSVSGFIKSQPYGKENALRKTIWVDGFNRSQWVRSGLNYISLKA